jgi:gamma-glutamyltranspeptidase/glutathione hydrolase
VIRPFIIACLSIGLLGAACTTPHPESGVNPEWPLTGASLVTDAPSAMVVSGSVLASEVGRDILQRGGNAVDAAVAVGFALAVVHPAAGNIGGGGFMVIRMDDSVSAIDYREMAPEAATRDMYVDLDGDPTKLSWTGHLAVGVPGSVAGMLEAQARFGRLSRQQVMAAAIALAHDGFVVDEHRQRSIDNHRARLYIFSASREAFLPNGQAPIAGTVWRQPDLARTLQTISDRGADGFYRGWVADRLVEEMERGGGLITHEDLAAYRAEWREPVEFKYRDYTVYSMAPASSGGITLALIMNILENADPMPPFGSAELIHFEAEAMRRAFTDRNVYLGDPEFVRLPRDMLLSQEYADSLWGTIDPRRATPTPTFDPSLSDGNSTTHYSVVDADGNAVSVTTTLNNSYGSHVTVAGAGFLLNDEMDDFATAPGKPNAFGLVQGEANAIVSHKRMLSSMTPSIVLDPEGELFLVVGTPGGGRIITMVYQVISNVIDHSMSLTDAVAAPRMHHQALPDSLRFEEGGFLEGTLRALEQMGHTLDSRNTSGDIEAIIRLPDGWRGVSDPRSGGGGAGY